MVRSNLPVYVHASSAVRAALGAQLDKVALAAIRAILKNRGSVEVAFQQIEYRQNYLALSSRVTAGGDLVVEIDTGDPLLGQRLILEDEFQRAERQARDEDRKLKEARRRLKTDRRR